MMMDDISIKRGHIYGWYDKRTSVTKQDNKLAEAYLQSKFNPQLNNYIHIKLGSKLNKCLIFLFTTIQAFEVGKI